MDKGTNLWGVGLRNKLCPSCKLSYTWYAHPIWTLVYQAEHAFVRHECKLTLDSISCKDCVLLRCGSSCPLPPLPGGKVRALTPLAADWFRGVPSPYHPSLPLLTLSPLLLLSLSLSLCLSHCFLATPRISLAIAPPAVGAPGVLSLIVFSAYSACCPYFVPSGPSSNRSAR